MKKNVIDEFISLLNNRCKRIEKSFNEAIDLLDNLDLINNVFSDENQDELTALCKASEEDFNKLVTFLITDEETELQNSVTAARFLAINGIELVESQVDKLRELKYRADVKKRSLIKSIEKRELATEKLTEYHDLEVELSIIKETGFLDNDTILRLFDKLNIKEEDQPVYINEILRFNKQRFDSLTKEMGKVNEEEDIELLDISEVEPSCAFEDLQAVFEKYHYDISLLSEELITLLMNEGNIENIESVFDSIERNHINFFKKNIQGAKLLTKFLLDARSEYIDECCKILREANLPSDFLRCYKPIFFPSNDEDEQELKFVTKSKRRKETSDDINELDQRDENLSILQIYGKHQDFKQNLELLESLGYDRRDLLKNQVKLLLTSHSILLRNLKELKLYEFPIGKERFPLSALSSPRIMELTDGFIEIGEEKYILKYASRLTAYADGTLERLYAFKKKDLPYRSTIHDGLMGHITNPKLPCELTDELIDEIIPKDCDNLLKENKYNDLLNKYLPMEISEDTLDDPIIKELDANYKNSNWSYNFNGVLISRKKFLRNYEFLKNTDMIPEIDKDTEQILLVSAIYKSKLNMSEIEKVSNGLMGAMAIGGKYGILKK